MSLQECQTCRKAEGFSKDYRYVYCNLNMKKIRITNQHFACWDDNRPQRIDMVIPDKDDKVKNYKPE